MAKKVLIIPSWYPNLNNDFVGSFFKEQALLMSENGFDIKILFGVEKQLGLFDYIKISLKNAFKKKDFLSSQYLIQEPKAYSFSIYHYKKWPSKLKLKKTKKLYNKAFSILTSNWKPCLLHAQCSEKAGIYSASISEKFLIPYVIIEHQTFLINHLKPYLQKEITNTIKNAYKLGAVSYHQQRCILMHNIDCHPKIIWNLLDESKFKILKKTNTKFTILTISYPLLIKDTVTFFKSLEAFNTLSNGDFEAIIIGNDSFNDIKKANSFVFINLAKKHNVLDKCKFYPTLDKSGINKQLQQCDVFVSTSIAETFGIAPREAMLCGKPVITTKNGGVEDAITPETGIAVNLKDYKSIAKNLLKIKNKELTYNPQTIRDFVIKQSGKKTFIKTMTNFYN